MTRSKASIEATSKWESKAYDRILVRLPKGTKNRIQATGATVNGYIVRAVLSALDNNPPTVPGETTDGE